MPNKIDFLALQAKLNLTDIWNGISHLPLSQVIPLTVSKADCYSIFGLNMFFIPIVSPLFLVSIHILNACKDKIQLSIMYYEPEGIVFYIPDALFNQLPSSFLIYVTVSDQEPIHPVPLFYIDGPLYVNPEETQTYNLITYSDFPVSFETFWHTEEKTIHIISFTQKSCLCFFNEDFVGGFISISCIIGNLTSSFYINPQ